MNEPTFDTVTHRLDRLDRDNRRLKQWGGITLVGLAAVVLMGQATTWFSWPLASAWCS